MEALLDWEVRVTDGVYNYHQQVATWPLIIGSLGFPPLKLHSYPFLLLSHHNHLLHNILAAIKS